MRLLVSVNDFTVDYAREVLADQAQDWDRTVLEQAAYVTSDDDAPPACPPAEQIQR